ncbi:LuxR C-terminal-related transcriptional regulator [Actinomadura rubrisoli]|uniref:HTH luxR-type domain-containing protein n=1 Tax=Actinomadura rubrisoli TaxID=2530368 RepID=A0A4R5AR78_9ACTN|nr:LuxR C-terminal-related transcriptional regulator [Actinomadura rubrisoli]TDD75421.1 hypothetical protein E1298_31595 [Actinomadura rubrisoli]
MTKTSSHEPGDRRPAVVDDVAGYQMKPDPLTAATTAELGELLREFWSWSGRPSARAVAAGSGGAFSHSTVSKILHGSGRRPFLLLPYLQGVIKGCGGDENDLRRWTTAWRKVQLTESAPPTADPASALSSPTAQEVSGSGGGRGGSRDSAPRAMEPIPDNLPKLAGREPAQGSIVGGTVVASGLERVSDRAAGPSAGASMLRTLVAVDIAGFGSRSEALGAHLRKSMYIVLDEALRKSDGLREHSYFEDRGDGVLIVIPPDTSTDTVLSRIPELMAEGLHTHNRFASEAAKLRLRIAVHAGHVFADGHGLSGHALIMLFRMLDAPEFKRAFAERDCDLGLITSETVFNEVVRHGVGILDEADFTGITVLVKDSSFHAWARWPGGGPAQEPRSSTLDRLSDAERRVAELASRGFTNRQIAQSLHISVSTVEQHLTRVYRKLRVNRRDTLSLALTKDRLARS